MNRPFLLCGVLLAGIACQVRAETSEDALQWLQRVTTAAGTLSYSGTFIYQNGTQTETSRIVRVVENGHQRERLEVLDGSPREVVREDDEVQCYLPENRLVVLERRSARRGFPSLTPEALAALTQVYTVRRGPQARVAGLDSQSVLVDPRDDLRYGRQFWIDTHSGLLLKAGLRDERGDLRESFTFTELRIGGTIDRAALKAHAAPTPDWRVHDIRAAEMQGEDASWTFNNPLPGFRRVSSTRRPPRPGSPESLHVVFSDGLAAISVFIEPQTPGKPRPETGFFSMGAINVYKRLVGDALLVVMGDVPPAALRILGDGIEARKK